MNRYHFLITTALSVLVASSAIAATEFPSRFSQPQTPSVPAPELAPAPTETVVPEAAPEHVLKLPPEYKPSEVAAPSAAEKPLTSEEIILLRDSANTSPTKAPQEKYITAPTEKTAAPVELISPAKKPTEMPQAAAPTDGGLKAALVNVYNNHPQLLAEREKLKVIDESVALAVSDFRPNATADYSKGRERQNGSDGVWNYGDTTSKGLTVTQPIFSGFSGVEGFKAAKQRVKAARADLVALEQQLLFNAIVAYTGVVEKQSVLKLSQNNVDVLTKQRDAAQVRFDVGELTKTDVAQAESRLATAIAAEQQALGDVSIARASYVRAVGVEPGDNVTMPVIPTGLPKDIAEANQLAQLANPIILAAKQREKAFASDVGVQAGGILPSVSVQGTARRSEGGNAFINRYENDAIKLNVTIPLYQSGAEWSRLRAARNSAQQAKYNTLDSALAVQQDVTSAWQNYVTAESIIISTEKAEKASALALEGVRQENEFGVRTMLDVLNAEQEYLDTKVNLVRATRVHKIEAYRLLASVGKLTAVDLGLDVKAYDTKENYNNAKYQLLGW